MPKIKLDYLNLRVIMKKDRMINRKIYRDNGNYVIDLHNFTVNEAIDFIDHTILHYYYINNINSPLEIIYGRGLHNGIGHSVLRDHVINRIYELKKKGHVLKWKQNKCKKGGAIIVYVNVWL